MRDFKQIKLSFQVNNRNILGNYIKTESIVKKLCKYFKWTAQKGSAMQ